MKRFIKESPLLKFAISEFVNQNEEDERIKLVYSYFGLAVYWAQCIEQTFENMIILYKIITEENVTRKYIDSIFQKIENSKATMGKQIHNIKRVYSISNIHEKELNEILRQRNYLAHNFFKDNSLKFYSNEGRKEMIEECVNFIDQSKSLDKELNLYYEKYKQEIGITEDVINNQLNAELEKERKRIKNNKNGG